MIGNVESWASGVGTEDGPWRITVGKNDLTPVGSGYVHASAGVPDGTGGSTWYEYFDRGFGFSYLKNTTSWMIEVEPRALPAGYSRLERVSVAITGSRVPKNPLKNAYGTPDSVAAPGYHAPGWYRIKMESYGEVVDGYLEIVVNSQNTVWTETVYGPAALKWPRAPAFLADGRVDTAKPGVRWTITWFGNQAPPLPDPPPVLQTYTTTPV